MDETTNKAQNEMSVQYAMAKADRAVSATVEDGATPVDRTNAPLGVVRDDVNDDPKGN